MPSLKLVAVWVVVVAATTLLAWQIVSLADSQVSATPMELLTPTTTTIPGASIPGASTSSSPSPSSTSSSAPTTSVGSAPTTSSTSAPDPGTAEWSVRTVTSTGGTVIVRHRSGQVELQAATPLPGYVMEIDDTGPDRVRVEFENDIDDVGVEIRWVKGALDVEISD
ncbi:MAG TPA: hypothetical protein VJ948_07615 [Acidimicrobiia bacterium]|nr:hypothetical protein [Acidimicrobiia bacterium]